MAQDDALNTSYKNNLKATSFHLFVLRRKVYISWIPDQKYQSGRFGLYLPGIGTKDILFPPDHILSLIM